MLETWCNNKKEIYTDIDNFAKACKRLRVVAVFIFYSVVGTNKKYCAVMFTSRILSYCVR